MSFYCDHCHFKNNEVQPASEMQERGSKYTFKADKSADLERQILKSDTAVLRVIEVDIEIPAGRGRLTNVEGIMDEIVKDLEAGQEQRKASDPDLHEKLQAVILSLSSLVDMARFTITIDDPTGNSWIEPSTDPEPREKYLRTQYARSADQNLALGLSVAKEERQPGNGALEAVPQVEGGMEDVDILEGQSYELPVHCPGCTNPAKMFLQMVNIPYFKQVVLSTTDCSACGYKANDVKTGGEIPDKGKRITLRVTSAEDLGRDILKSESCMLKIPDCKIEVVPGTMGGRFTTVEGLLTQIRDDLRSSIFDADDENAVPDSMPAEKRSAWEAFFDRMEKAIKAEIEFTIELEDPLASSYCQSLSEELGRPDAQITEEEYERSAEEEEELGLTDMKTHLNEAGEYVKEPAAPQAESTSEEEAAVNGKGGGDIPGNN